MFKLQPALTMRLIKMGWVTQPLYKGNKFIIINPDNEEETYTFKTNNQIVWFLRGFESGLKKTEKGMGKAEKISDLLDEIDSKRTKEDTADE